MELTPWRHFRKLGSIRKEMAKWKFWKKADLNRESHSISKDAPGFIKGKLTIHLGKDPDWIWNLKAVARRRQDRDGVYDIRIFNAADAASKQIKVRNFTSLDSHPELILFEGSYDKRKNSVEIFHRTNSLHLDRAA